jgi:hypothetical protein
VSPKLRANSALSRIKSGVTLNGLQGASTTLPHGKAAGIMKTLDDSLAVTQNRTFLLGAAVGRQPWPLPRLMLPRRAAVEANPYGLSGGELLFSRVPFGQR